jgi:hypothetical protein
MGPEPPLSIKVDATAVYYEHYFKHLTTSICSWYLILKFHSVKSVNFILDNNFHQRHITAIVSHIKLTFKLTSPVNVVLRINKSTALFKADTHTHTHTFQSYLHDT